MKNLIYLSTSIFAFLLVLSSFGQRIIPIGITLHEPLNGMVVANQGSFAASLTMTNNSATETLVAGDTVWFGFTGAANLGGVILNAPLSPGQSLRLDTLMLFTNISQDPNSVTETFCAMVVGPYDTNLGGSWSNPDYLNEVCVNIVLNGTNGGGPCNDSYATLNVSTCSSYRSPSGKYTWSTPGTYQDTIANASGCDSILTIHLSQGANSHATLNTSTCSSYRSPSGKYTWNTPGTYTDTIPNSAGCDSIITIHLTVGSVDVGVTQHNETLKANASGVQYQWVNCDLNYAPIPGATDQEYEAEENGRYAVIITEGNCKDTSDCYTVSGLSMDNPVMDNHISVYPNPTSGSLNLQLGFEGNKSIRVINALGAEVWQGNTSERELQLNLDQEVEGNYLILIHSEMGRVMKRITLKK